MLTKAGFIKVPKYMQELVKTRLKINKSAPNEYYIIPSWVNCQESAYNTLEKLTNFIEKHYGEIEIVKDEFLTDIEHKGRQDRTTKGSKILRDRKIIIKMYGEVERQIEKILKEA